MQLSKKEHIIPETINLAQWFGVLIDEFTYQNGIDIDQVHSRFASDAEVIIDSSQLYQIIWNIMSNSVKYGANRDGHITLYIDSYLQDNMCVLELSDAGEGIPAKIQAHMFEPFYSGSNSSGLGLYIVRELCDMNHIDISYHYDDTGQRGNPYFRLMFNQTRK